jgi:uncharacterized membrane protein
VATGHRPLPQLYYFLLLRSTPLIPQLIVCLKLYYIRSRRLSPIGSIHLPAKDAAVITSVGLSVLELWRSCTAFHTTSWGARSPGFAGPKKLGLAVLLW